MNNPTCKDYVPDDVAKRFEESIKDPVSKGWADAWQHELRGPHGGDEPDFSWFTNQVSKHGE